MCWASHRKRKQACRICALPREGAKPQPVPQAVQSSEVSVEKRAELMRQKGYFESCDLPAVLKKHAVEVTEASLRSISGPPAAAASKSVRALSEEAQREVDEAEA